MIPKTVSHYEILSPLGAGGMGEVYRARDTKLEREVALKVLAPKTQTDPEARKRFEREAQILAGLNHPNIVTVFSVEEDGDTLFLTMELVEGVTLAERLAKDPPGPDEMCNILLPLADGLSAAHARGVVHRDIKPGNIMLTADGRVKLLDFGLAKLNPALKAGGRTEVLLTQAGSLTGTLSYMSPEQVRGETVDVRSDLFSLGVLMYEMATGHLPFPGQSPAETISGILRDAPPRCTALDGTGIERLATVVERCLEKDPENRYQTAAELLEELKVLSEARKEGPQGLDRARRNQGDLDRGRRAHARQKWAEAYDALSRADAAEALSGSDLEKLGEAAWWAGKREEHTRVLERAFAKYVEEGNHSRAGLMATELAETYYLNERKAMSRGWLKRAERLFSEADSAEKGHWIRLQIRFSREDPDRCLEIAGRTLEIGKRFKDPDLEAIGLMDMGYTLVSLGRIGEGMPMIDEAMAAAAGGSLTPMTTGRIYCNMMGVCEQLADYRRASEWSEASEAWCQPHSDSTFPGICQVHRAGVMRVKGDWAGAAPQARKAHESLGGYMHDVAAEAQYEIGEIQLRRGDLEEARESFRQAHEHGRDPMPGLARLRLLEGDPKAARKLMDRALDETRTPLKRAPLLPVLIDIAVAEGDLAAAETAVTELQEIARTYASEVYEAAALHGKGAILLEQGKPAEAAAELRRAWKMWKELDLPYDGSRTRLLMGEAYRAAENPEDARLEFQAAESIFKRLGAERDHLAAAAALSSL